MQRLGREPKCPLRCKIVRRAVSDRWGNVDCLDENTVVAYVEGRLSADDERRVLLHSDGCASCRRLVAATAHMLVPAVSPLDPTEPRLPDAAEPFVAGQNIGRYVVRDLIGAGGMGIVYEAYDPELERKVALKLMRADSAASHGNELRQRLLREAQAMARIRHPNVITIYDVGTIGDGVFLAMELIEGTTLTEWQRASRSALEIVRAYALAGEGLQAAHDVGVVHRDFKPDNVLVGGDGRVCVTDFGLARPLTVDEPSGDSGVDVASTVTRAGLLVGTPAYMAPEQMRGEPADARADQFGFAVSLYEALHGKRPFAGKSLDELHRAMKDGRRVPDERRGVPARVRNALVRALSFEPAARFPSMSALLDRLRPRRPIGLPLALVASLLLAFGLGWRHWQTSSRAQLCNHAADRMRELWSRAHQAALKQALEAAGSGEAWPSVARGFDEYARRWMAAHGEACQATYARGEQSEALLDLRLDCLDQRFQDTRALLDVLVDGKAAAKAPGLTRALPSIAACNDVAVLRRGDHPSIDPARVASLRTQVARARAEVYADECKQGLDDARAAATAAHTLGALGEEHRAQLRLGDAHACLGNHAQAQNSFLESAVVAAREHDDVGVAHAYLALMQNAQDQQKLADADHWAQLAGEAVERVGSDVELRADYLLAVCTLDYYRERRADAEKHCGESLGLYRQLPSPNVSSQANATQLLGMMAGDDGRFAEAETHYREAQRLFTELEGPESHDAVRVLESLAADELEQDRVAEALALQKRVVDTAEKRAWSGDLVESLGFYGGMLLEAGRPAEALSSLQQARELDGKMEEPPPFLLAVILRGIAASEEALGKSSQALADFAAAWKLMPAEGVEYERAQLANLYARALWPTDHHKASSLARLARDYLRKNPLGAFRKRKLAELDAWLQAHGESR
jgi:eukaryotic-like serine/threonine-protein kinase